MYRALILASIFCLSAVPAYATNNDPKGGSAEASASAVAVGGGATVTNVNAPTNTNTNVGVNTQGQQQGQRQRQSQGQGQAQGQNNDQTIAPSQSVNIEGTNFDRYAPPVSAPGLTAAGTGVCLGSVSIGLSGPMAGLSFGITKVDKGCERRSGAALLYQMGYRDAAIRLLSKDDEIREAMGLEAPKSAKKASGVVVVDEAVFQSTNFGQMQGN